MFAVSRTLTTLIHGRLYPQCNTYPDHAPILSLWSATTSLTIYLDDNEADAALSSVADLASAVARYAEAVRVWHARRTDNAPTEDRAVAGSRS